MHFLFADEQQQEENGVHVNGELQCACSYAMENLFRHSAKG